MTTFAASLPSDMIVAVLRADAGQYWLISKNIDVTKYNDAGMQNWPTIAAILLRASKRSFTTQCAVWKVNEQSAPHNDVTLHYFDLYDPAYTTPTPLTSQCHVDTLDGDKHIRSLW